MAPHADQLTAAGVRIRGLTRRYGDRVVLDRVDLDIAPGEFVALLGRSGSGKTTLLRTLAGLDPWEGDVSIPERVSVAFQDSRLLPWRRVLDNVVLGQPPAGRRERGIAALAEVGLAGRERAWPHQLSGGEQQRVALARSLVGEPQLLLADEPFGALDALTRLKMHELLRSLCARHRPAVLLVTHDVDEAVKLADRIVVLDAGTIAIDLTLELPGPRRPDDTAVLSIRDLLLRALGVTP